MPEPAPDKPPKERKPRKPRKAKQPPPEADAPPRPKAKSGAAKRSEKRGRELRLIETGLVEFLTFPAVPAAAFEDAWAVDHFTTRGPQLAERITAECERSDQLRSLVLKLVQGQRYMMLAVELGLYTAPALMHYGLLPGAEKMGVPVLGRKKDQPSARQSSHGARQAPPAPAGAPEGNGAAPEPPAAAEEAYVQPGEVTPPDQPPPIEFA